METRPGGVAWKKASRSGIHPGNNCVEVAGVDDRVAVRDSKDPGGPTLMFTRDGWAAFVAAAKNGDYDDYL
jgi:hypothetical protein